MGINYFCNHNDIGVNRRYGCQEYSYPQMPQAYNSVGPAGPQGPQGPQGLQGMVGVQGVAGPKGATGATGATGQTGATGMAATVRVEASTSVPFNDAPQVTNVGTPQAAVLRFAIPAGRPGTTGEQGPKGDTGSVGPAGPRGATGLQGATGIQGNTGPTGPKGPTGPAGIKTFGQINSIIANADLLKDIQTQIPLTYGGEFNNVNLAQNTITVKEAGYYTLSYAMYPYLTLTEGYADLTLTIRKNGVDIPQTGRTIRSTRGTHDLSFYGSTIVELEAGDVIDTAFKCNEDGRFFFSRDNISSLFLYKIS